LSGAWAFAVAAWRRPGVEAICLDLQDRHGQSPILLLWRLWALETKRTVGPETLAAAIDAAHLWEAEILQPLRALRQALAATGAPVAEAARIAARRRVLDAELEAERALVDTLAALDAPQETSAGAMEEPRLAALIELAAAWRPPAPSSMLERLAEAL
jgi:uncharacterized protein (TIGR02444 family)